MNNPGPHSHYKNLIVYQKAVSLTKEVAAYFSKFKLPKSYEFVIIQLLKSVSSIGANIAEGYGRHYKKDYRHFLSIARGSSFETDYWLEIIKELENTDKDKVNSFVD